MTQTVKLDVQTNSLNSQNELTAFGSAALTYDNNGNTTKDDNGNTATYDAWNRMAGYSYDANSNRIGDGRTNTYFSADGNVLEIRYAGAVRVQLVWGLAYVNSLVLQDDATVSGSYGKSGSGVGERLYVQQGRDWSVTALTSPSGSVLDRFDYTPWGMRGDIFPNWQSNGFSPGPYSFPYGFQGGRTNGIYQVQFGSRDYSTTMGRWLEQDPAGYIDGANRYQAMGDSPVTEVDPSGLKGGSTYTSGQLSGSWWSNYGGALVHPTLYNQTAGTVAGPAWVQNTTTAASAVAMAATILATGGAAGEIAGGWLGADEAATWGGSFFVNGVSGGATAATYNAVTQLAGDQPFSWSSFYQSTLFGTAAGGAAGWVAKGLSIFGQDAANWLINAFNGGAVTDAGAIFADAMSIADAATDGLAGQIGGIIAAMMSNGSSDCGGAGQQGQPPKGPAANGGETDYLHGGVAHDDAINDYVQNRVPAGAEDVRKNQWQRDVDGNVVGNNKPDIQYNYNGQHYVVEIDNSPSASSAHAQEIQQNDPNAHVTQISLGK